MFNLLLRGCIEESDISFMALFLLPVDRGQSLEIQKNIVQPNHIVGKKWDPGILDPSRFSGQIKKVEARLGKLAKIRKVETN